MKKNVKKQFTNGINTKIHMADEHLGIITLQGFALLMKFLEGRQSVINL